MFTCPLPSNETWKKLVEIHGENKAKTIWIAYKGEIPSKFLIVVNAPLRVSTNVLVEQPSVVKESSYEEASKKADLKQPIVQNFFGRYRPNSDLSKVHNWRPEIQKKYGYKASAIHLVKMGVRTRTSRSSTWFARNNVNVGDYVWQYNEKQFKETGEKVLTKITAVYYKEDPRFESNWYKEGWDDDVFNFAKEDNVGAIEFEVIPQPETLKTEEDVKKESTSQEVQPVIEQPSVVKDTNYTYVDFAKDNAGVLVTVKYDRFPNAFEATLTGNVIEKVSGEDKFGKYKYVAIEAITNSGKRISVNPFTEISGKLINKEKLTKGANVIRESDKRYSTLETNNNNLQEGLNWLKQIMPDTEPVLVDGLIDNIANGSYDILNDLITLSKDYANKQVVKEEAFHRWWEKMTPNREEVNNILNQKIKNGEIRKNCK